MITQNESFTKTENTKASHIIRIPWLVLAALIILMLAPLSLSAQSALEWSIARHIPGIDDDTDTPYLIADQNRTVHAFFSQVAGGQLGVFYAYWTLEHGWSKPVNILLSPNQRRATVLGAFLDAKGIMHLIFLGGDQYSSEIYYSQAPAVNAGEARAWSTPKMVGNRATSPPSAALTGDAKGNLYVIYGGNRDGNGIYAVRSVDGGEIWSTPIAVFQTGKKSLTNAWPQLVVDKSGWLQAIWTVITTAGQGRGIYYSRMNLGNGEWSLPIALANTPGGLGVRDPALTEHNGRLFAAFYDANLDGKYVMRTSDDAGQSWAEPIVPFPDHVGANGSGSFVEDANDDLHLFWGQRIPSNPDIHGMWHSTYQGDQWSAPDPIVSGPPSSEFDPSLPRAVASQGNKLLVLWRQDPGLAGNGLWYSYATINAKELPIVPLPVPTASEISAPTAAATQVAIEPTPTVLQRATTLPKPTPTLQPVDPAVKAENNPNLNILWAVIPVALLVIFVVARNLK